MRCEPSSLQAQAEPSGCRSGRSHIPSPARTRSTSSSDGAAVARAVAEGFTHVAFGDLFLEDVRRYREEKLAGTGLTPLFPLVWLGHARSSRAR